jgi:putative LysE/RhtB family amino acid efflux pump
VVHGYALGLLLAAQVGPVTLLIVRSVLRGGRAVAVGLAMAGAVALVDVLYATVGLAGAGLSGGPAPAALGIASAAVLIGTVSFPAAAPHVETSAQAAAVLVGVTLGTLTWYAGISTAVALARRQVGPRFVAAVDLTAGCGLVGFGALLGYRSIHER